MSSQPLQGGKPIIKRCPACGSRVGADQKVCPICGHEFSGTKPVPILSPDKQAKPAQPAPAENINPSVAPPPVDAKPATRPTPATPISQPISKPVAATPPVTPPVPPVPPPTSSTTSKTTLTTASGSKTQPIKTGNVAKASTRPAIKNPDEVKSTSRPIKPLTPPASKPIGVGRGNTQPNKPASQPVPPPDDFRGDVRGDMHDDEIEGHRVTGAAKAIKPVTMMLGAQQRRIPWGLIGVMAMVIVILVAAFLLAQNSGILSPASPASPDATSAAMAGVDATPGTLGEQLPVAAPTNADPAADPAVNSTVDPASTALAEAAPAVTDAPTPTPILVTATPVPPQEYTIVAGDTCGTIAEKFGISLADFLAANSLSEANCTRIRIGDTLTIPAPPPTPGPSPTPQPLGGQGDASAASAAAPAATLPPELVYEVQSGDVCGKIVQKFPTVTIDQIIQQNNLDANCTIQVGQKLVLKFSSAAATATSPAQVAATPTPRTGYSAPQLVSPAEGAVLTDTQATVKLQWLSAGLLKENEYYVVQVQATGAITAPVWETKATSLDIAQDLVGSATEQTFTWFVSVKQKLATDPKTNAPIYNDLSPISQQRQFTWYRSQGTATPAP